MNYASKVIEIAEKEVGYLEKKSNSNLDSKTANAGYNNWTKYGRDLIKWVGSPYANGVAWCDMFVDWCFITAYGLAEAKKLLNGWSAYVPTSKQYFKNQGAYYTSNPKVGDVIIFKDANGTPCHTGIVYGVDANFVYTIEGNTSDASGVIANGGGVFKKKYALTYSRIDGYGRPNFDKEPAPAKTDLEVAQKFNKGYAGTYKATSNVNIRLGAGTTKKALGKVKKGGVVICYGYYNTPKKTRWLLVQYGSITGYVASKRLTKI